jgi:hypothetical protein
MSWLSCFGYLTFPPFFHVVLACIYGSVTGISDRIPWSMEAGRSLVECILVYHSFILTQ